jgi:hypothetical protein
MIEPYLKRRIYMQQQGMNSQGQYGQQSQNLNMQNQQGMSQSLNMNQQNQQGIMTQPPGVITGKDAMYLNDMLSWNLLAMKKAHFFAEQCQDPEIKTIIDQCGQMHQRHYQQILGHMDVHLQNQNQPNTGLQ